MTDKPKRPWFRFHLLTAVLMMVAAGGFVWANSTWRSGKFELNESIHGVSENIDSNNGALGWPFIVAMFQYPDEMPAGFIDEEVWKQELHWYWRAVLLNGATLLLILLTCAFISERLIRRREARKL